MLLTTTATETNDRRDDDSGELGVLDGLRVLVAPGRVFSRIEDTAAYGWSLVVLLTLATLMGYLLVQSGLIDAAIDKHTEKELARIESSTGVLVDRIALRQSLEDARKQGEFNKTLARLQPVVLTPIGMMASFLLVSSMLYAIVALSGRKPEWHTLMSICVYAGFIDLVASALNTAMLFYYRRMDIDTSLRALANAGEPTVLAGIDPFRAWFWCLMALGLIVTQQLSRRIAVAICVLSFVVASGVRVAMEYAPGF